MSSVVIGCRVAVPRSHWSAVPTPLFDNISQLLRDSFSVSQQPPIWEPSSHYSMGQALRVAAGGGVAGGCATKTAPAAVNMVTMVQLADPTSVSSISIIIGKMEEPSASLFRRGSQCSVSVLSLAKTKRMVKAGHYDL